MKYAAPIALLSTTAMLVCLSTAASAGGLKNYRYAPPSEPGAEQPHAVSVYSELEVLEDSYFIGNEIIFAFNRDLSRPGFLVRGTIGTGDDDYFNSAVPGGQVDDDPFTGDLMLGYQNFLPGNPNIGWRLFAGVDYADYDLTPADPSNPFSGSETGFKVAGSVGTQEARPFFLNLYGEYSTAYDTYYSNLRVGHKFGKFIIGPEGTLLGDESFDNQRLGGFVNFPVRLSSLSMDVSIAGGYVFADNDSSGGIDFSPRGASDDGGYLTIGFGTEF